MIVPILSGVIALLYLAGLALASEYVDVMEEQDFKQGIPKIAAKHRILFLLAWPYHMVTAVFSGSRNAR